MSPRGRLLTVGQAAAHIGVTESRMRTLVSRGEVAVLKSARGRVLGIYERDAEAWVTSRRVLPSTEQPVDDRIAQFITQRRFG